MPTYKFQKIKDKDNQFDVSNVTVEVETESLLTLLEEFKLFLLASGYSVNGEIVVEASNDNV